MDPRLQVVEARRDLAASVQEDLPLVTIAWRALRAQGQREGQQRQRAEAERLRVEQTLLTAAETVARLRHLAQGHDSASGSALLALADNLEQALAGAEVRIWVPEQAPWEGLMLELFDNIAQRPDPECKAPRVAEVVSPAVTKGDSLLRMGKVIVATPMQKNDNVDGGCRD